MDMTTPMQPKPLVDATCKLGEKGCFNDGRCHALGDCENKIVTNADCIRAMSNEELADIFSRTDSRRGYTNLTGWLDWLKQPYKEEADG